MRLSPDDKRILLARAATIYERGASCAVAPPTPQPGQHLDRWQQAFAPGDPAAFARRLAWDGFDPASAAAAIARTDIDRWPLDTGWILWLDRFLTAAYAGPSFSDTGVPSLAADPSLPFADIWLPILRAGRETLDARLDHTSPPQIAPAAERAFDRQLALEIGRYGDAAMFETFRRWLGAAAPDADPSSPAEYRLFVEHLRTGGFVEFFRDHAVLARQLATIVDRWVETTAELLARLEADRQAIASEIGDGTDPGTVVSITPALSDPHHGRRRVVAVEFASGLRVVYKPRGIRIDHAFAGVVSFLNPGLGYPLRTLRVVDRATHGWVEYAVPGTFERRDDVSRYFYRAGALMAITSALGSRDLHRDNVVATSDGPMLIDVELLLQPESRGASMSMAGETSDTSAAPVASCLTSGLLTLIDLTPDGEPHDAGGLRGERAGTLPFPRREWRAVGTNAVHFVDEPTFAAGATHEVVLDGVVQRPEHWGSDITRGFGDAYCVLLARRHEMFTASGPLAALETCVVRVLPRPTNQYAMLAHLLATPRYQRDGIVASCAIDVLHRSFNADASLPVLWPVAVAERRAMLALDIPYFSVRCDGTDAMAGDRVIVPDYFATSPIEVARARLAAMSDADLVAQTAQLERALGESVRSQFAAPFPHADPRRDEGPAFVACAEWIAGELRARARDTADGLSWEYRRPAADDAWRAHYLYDGHTGPALFFTALAAVTNDPVWVATARSTVDTIEAFANRVPIEQVPADEPVGGASGLGSVVYALTLVASVSNDSRTIELATRIARAIPSRLQHSRQLDVVDGAAGAVLALVALYRTTGDADVLAAARFCGDRLIAAGDAAGWQTSADVYILGFAHGLTGMACALARLASVTGESRYARSARRLARLVRRRRLQPSGNWPIANAGGRAAGGVMNGWCHGAPGISLGALAGVDARPCGATRRAAESALRTVATWQAAQSDHICCGALARADTLLTAGIRLERPDLIESARGFASRVMERSGPRRHFRLSGAGTEYRVFDPGFFQGLSGIGYQLLRMAHPLRLPSVLAFDDASQASLRYCSGWPAAAAGGRVEA